MLKKGIDTKSILENKGNQQVNINIINTQTINILCNDNGILCQYNGNKI